jgi:prepilin-type N-terminal cleavage/methylation domain-containing protein
VIVRKAFTLMELMIVVGIIALLAGLAFPSFTLIKRQVNQVKCSNNLRQIALALEVYRQDHDDRFPYFLRTNQPGDVDNTANVEVMELPPKTFLCPFDKKRGTDSNMGRLIGGNWGNYKRLYEPGCSYCYEMSSLPNSLAVGPGRVIQDDVDYFYRDDPTKAPALTDANWAAMKQHQQKFGNMKPNGSWGAPFTPDAYPIIRCYWHEEWKYSPSNKYPRAVLNVALGFNIFKSTPYWEIDLNPLIPP